MNNAEAQRAWRAQDRQRLGYFRKWSIEWRKFYNIQALIILRDKDLPDPTIQAFQVKQVEKLFIAMYMDIGRAFARINFLEPKGINPYDTTKADNVSVDDLLVWEKEMRMYALLYGGDSIVSISDTGKELAIKMLRLMTDQAISEGVASYDLEQWIKTNFLDEWKITGKFNAERIARTELGAAANHGAFVGAKSTGLNLNKIWMTALDGRERESHANAHLQTVKMNQPFIVGGSQMNTPNDKSAPAEEVINCRCAVAYRDARSFVI